MKKFLLLVFVILIIFSFIGCSNSDELETQVEALETQVNNLENQIQEIINYLYSLQPVDNQEVEPVESQEPQDYYENTIGAQTLQITEDKYNAIELGSSYEDIVSLIGDYGILVSNVGTKKTFVWSTNFGENINSIGAKFHDSAFLKFTDNKLVEKWLGPKPF